MYTMFTIINGKAVFRLILSKSNTHKLGFIFRQRTSVTRLSDF